MKDHQNIYYQSTHSHLPKGENCRQSHCKNDNFKIPITVVNMRAQHITFNRAIKALPLHLQTDNIELHETMNVYKLVIYMVECYKVLRMIDDKRVKNST